jgi:hypothetical protein
VRRAEGNTYKRIHWFCCSLLQRWNPTVTDGMASFDMQLDGFSLYPYYKARIVQAHVCNGVIPPGQLPAGRQDVTVVEICYTLPRSYFDPESCIALTASGQCNRTNQGLCSRACAQHARSILSQARSLPTSRARGHRASQSCHEVEVKISTSLRPPLQQEGGREG